MYLVYSVLTAAAALLLVPYFLVQSIRHPHKQYWKNLGERLGLRFPAELGVADGQAPGAIWIHAVSVGEALAALPLARTIKDRFAERRLVISTTTATGQALARERMKFADAVFYFPLDWSGAARRTLRAVRPAVVVVFETEIWPNFLREARRAGVPVVFVNGRLSERSFGRYARALRFSGGTLGGFLRRVLNDGTLYAMQSEADAERLLALGAPRERVVVAGNMKYDLMRSAESALTRWLKEELPRLERSPVLVAGSVTAGEEGAVLEALSLVSQKWPRALLVLAPRKPERFEAAAELIGQAGRRAVRRSSLRLAEPGDESNQEPENVLKTPGSVLLLDTIGELAGLYELADATFIGGSLEPMGGHNPLEPASFGRVPVFGASMENFREIAASLLLADAAIQVDSGKALGTAWLELLGDGARRRRMGMSALELVERSRGATAATAERIAALVEAAAAKE